MAPKPLILATKDSEYLAAEVHGPLGESADYERIQIKRFANGESDVTVPHVRGRRVYIFHTPVIDDDYNPDTFFIQAALIDDATRRSIQGGSIVYVTPHLPYQRQDRQDKPRKPISSRRTMLSFFDPAIPVPTSMITFDMHNEAIAGQVPFQIDQLYASSLLLKDFKGREDVVFVAPDTGATKRTRAVAKTHAADAEIVIIDKRRMEANSAEVVNVVGAENVRGKACIMYDDICDTAGTIVRGARALFDAGAKEVNACFVHPILSTDKSGVKAEDKLRNAGIKAITTNSIWRYARHNSDFLKYVSLGPLIAETIRRMERGDSVSELFKE